MCASLYSGGRYKKIFSISFRESAGHFERAKGDFPYLSAYDVKTQQGCRRFMGQSGRCFENGISGFDFISISFRFVSFCFHPVYPLYPCEMFFESNGASLVNLPAGVVRKSCRTLPRLAEAIRLQRWRHRGYVIHEGYSWLSRGFLRIRGGLEWLQESKRPILPGALSGCPA